VNTLFLFHFKDTHLARDADSTSCHWTSVFKLEKQCLNHVNSQVWRDVIKNAEGGTANWEETAAK